MTSVGGDGQPGAGRAFARVVEIARPSGMGSAGGPASRTLRFAAG